ncbi:MAG: hypothetical protein WCK31_01590 [bacterium]
MPQETGLSTVVTCEINNLAPLTPELDRSATAIGKAREGAYLLITQLEKIGIQNKRDNAVLNNIKYAIKDITDNKNNALSHLCLSTRTLRYISRNGFKTIEDLRRKILDGTIQDCYGLNDVRLNEVLVQLKEFDKLNGVESTDIFENINFQDINDSSEAISLAKEGGYVNIDKLKQIRIKFFNQEKIFFNINLAILDIQKNGNESICHLCLTKQSYDSLRRYGVSTIRSLREKLLTSDIGYMQGVVEFDVISKLSDFDNKLKKITDESGGNYSI